MIRVPVCRSVRRLLAENNVPLPRYRQTYRRTWRTYVADNGLWPDLLRRLVVRWVFWLVMATLGCLLLHVDQLLIVCFASVLLTFASAWSNPVDGHLEFNIAKQTRLQLGLPAKFVTIADIKRSMVITHHKK